MLRSPARFWNSQDFSIRTSIVSALTFGLVTHWIGSALSFISTSADFAEISEKLSEVLKSQGQGDFLARLPLSKFDWWFGTTGLVLDPLFTLFWIVVSALFLYLSCLIFVPRRDIFGQEARLPLFEDAIRIISYAQAASLFSSIPYIGWIIKSIFLFFITVAGIEASYRTTRGRAVWITVFPGTVGLLATFGIGFVIFLMFYGLFNASHL